MPGAGVHSTPPFLSKQCRRHLLKARVLVLCLGPHFCLLNLCTWWPSSPRRSLPCSVRNEATGMQGMFSGAAGTGLKLATFLHSSNRHELIKVPTRNAKSPPCTVLGSNSHPSSPPSAVRRSRPGSAGELIACADG